MPDREMAVVPDALFTLCRRCPMRERCLHVALDGGELGYWAGTTSADRALMRELGRRDTGAADRLQEAARAAHEQDALHEAGQGSFRWYRRGCRCGECREANRDTRARERASRRRAA